jgi:hypothetical protein
MNNGLLRKQFFDRLRERGELLADSLHGGLNGIIADLVSKEVTTHLTDPGQWYELLGIQISQPGEKAWSVLGRGSNLGWPWSVDQFS